MISLLTDKKSFISGDMSGKKYNVKYDETLCAELVELQELSESCETREEFNGIQESFAKKLEDFTPKTIYFGGTKTIVRLPETGKLHLSFKEGVHSRLYFPQALEDMLIYSLEEDIDFSPIVKVVEAFMFNPLPTQDRLEMLANYLTATFVDRDKYNELIEEGFSNDVAIERSTYRDLQITKEGFLKTSKVATEITEKWSIVMADGKPVMVDGKPKKELVPRYATSWEIDESTGECTKVVDTPQFLEQRAFKPAIYSGGDNFFSGDVEGYKYEVGKLASLRDWDKVAMKDNCKHEKGLHVGGLRYIENYVSSSREVLRCFVCPSKIGKFTDDGIGEMTVLEMFIYDCTTIEDTTEGMYHSSAYQETRRVEFQKMLEDASAAKAEEAADIALNAGLNASCVSSLFDLDQVEDGGQA